MRMTYNFGARTSFETLVIDEVCSVEKNLSICTGIYINFVGILSSGILFRFLLMQVVIEQNPVIYYFVPARTFQGLSTKGETKARNSSLAKGLFIGNVFTAITGFTFLV